MLCPSSRRCSLAGLCCCRRAGAERSEQHSPGLYSWLRICRRRRALSILPRTRRTILDPQCPRYPEANEFSRRILVAAIPCRKIRRTGFILWTLVPSTMVLGMCIHTQVPKHHTWTHMRIGRCKKFYPYRSRRIQCAQTELHALLQRFYPESPSNFLLSSPKRKSAYWFPLSAPAPGGIDSARRELRPFYSPRSICCKHV